VETLGKPLAEGAYIGEFMLHEAKEVKLEMYKRIKKGEYVNKEESYFKKDGTIRWRSCRLSPVKDSNNEITGVVVSMKDITSSKLAELEQEKMTSDIAERNKELEKLAHIVSHNLRAPVANIMAIYDALTNYELTGNERKAMLNGLSGNAQKLDSVIMDLNQILHAKRKIDKQKENTNFRTIVNQIKVQIHPLLKKQKVKIITNFKSADGFFTNKNYLHSIFYNLISNSIKFHNPGIDPVIKISSKKSDKNIVLTFKDNGIGIDLSGKKEQVFGPYKRFHTNIEGKGMGLYMCKLQVQALGGKIDIVSKPNEGTLFTIEFPNS
jgi:signal transduction histidine kinase